MTLALTRPELVGAADRGRHRPGPLCARATSTSSAPCRRLDLAPPRRRARRRRGPGRRRPRRRRCAPSCCRTWSTRDGASGLAAQPRRAAAGDARAHRLPGRTGERQRYAGPAWCLRGARSDYVDAAGEQALRRLFPQMRIATVPDAGHWPHAEQPAAFQALLARRRWRARPLERGDDALELGLADPHLAQVGHRVADIVGAGAGEPVALADAGAARRPWSRSPA